MKYADFRVAVAKYPYFRSHILGQLTDQENLLRSQLVSWVKKGYVLELKRGIYTLNESDRNVGLTSAACAEILYSPSYLSLEYALSFYQMIPEQVVEITSVTSKKTQTFNNVFGHYTYHHIKTVCFQGFIQQSDEFNNPYLIAMPEKALVDYLYFHLPDPSTMDKDWFEESLRLQNVEKLDIKKIKQFSSLFQQKKLMVGIALLEKYYAGYFKR